MISYYDVSLLQFSSSVDPWCWLLAPWKNTPCRIAEIPPMSTAAWLCYVSQFRAQLSPLLQSGDDVLTRLRPLGSTEGWYSEDFSAGELLRSDFSRVWDILSDRTWWLWRWKWGTKQIQARMSMCRYAPILHATLAKSCCRTCRCWFVNMAGTNSPSSNIYIYIFIYKTYV